MATWGQVRIIKALDYEGRVYRPRKMVRCTFFFKNLDSLQSIPSWVRGGPSFFIVTRAHSRTRAHTYAPHVRASLTDYTLLGKRKRVSVANDGRMWIGVSPKGERNDHILSLGWPNGHPLERMFHTALNLVLNDQI